MTLLPVLLYHDRQSSASAFASSSCLTKCCSGWWTVASMMLLACLSLPGPCYTKQILLLPLTYCHASEDHFAVILLTLVVLLAQFLTGACPLQKQPSVSLDFLVLAVILCLHTGLQHSKEASNVLPKMHCCTGLHVSRLSTSCSTAVPGSSNLPMLGAASACNCESFDNPIAYQHAVTFDWLRLIHKAPCQIEHGSCTYLAHHEMKA